MTLIPHAPEVQCDGCEVRVSVQELGRWLQVQTVVGTPDAFMELADAESRGLAVHMHGDFCSLVCLGNWARNAQTLKEMEQLWDEDGKPRE